MSFLPDTFRNARVTFGEVHKSREDSQTLQRCSVFTLCSPCSSTNVKAVADGFDRLSSLVSFARAERRDFSRFELMLTAFTASVWKEGGCSVRARALAMQCATSGGCESDPASLKGGCGSAAAIAGGLRLCGMLVWDERTPTKCRLQTNVGVLDCE